MSYVNGKMFRAGAFLLLGIVVVSIPTSWTVWQFSQSGCHVEPTATKTSPHGVWTAQIGKETCTSAFIPITTLVDIVQVVQTGTAPSNKSVVFSKDAFSEPGDTPVLRWLTPRLLQVTVPNKSMIGISKKEVDDVAIQVKSDPDDPEERKRWLKEIEQGPK